MIFDKIWTLIDKTFYSKTPYCHMIHKQERDSQYTLHYPDLYIKTYLIESGDSLFKFLVRKRFNTILR